MCERKLNLYQQYIFRDAGGRGSFRRSRPGCITTSSVICRTICVSIDPFSTDPRGGNHSVAHNTTKGTLTTSIGRADIDIERFMIYVSDCARLAAASMSSTSRMRTNRQLRSTT